MRSWLTISITSLQLLLTFTRDKNQKKHLDQNQVINHCTVKLPNINNWSFDSVLL